ncbi:FAD-binding oxidoreductase [Paenarthrobacter ureafaciens]|uniref:NAD(P)/FAD-dependent oxidoreductase n=1 Tax=Paenarthrobacter ureafaciens TaxID=37931 RepID=UPI00140DAF91|nr:FAD-dependent oxidoreductase [Paenarthrobacter ureafaciens]MCX8453665.1 FAD-dependent oxidoreductase [Paenarthrobacter ureafaciens]MCY0973324.1 FAD-dependent oxidoreductase [Paenarthrobacter ureafaciens]NWL26586.1 FAD-binding oxidoreductase [Paenarthrobacter ureafaciens]
MKSADAVVIGAGVSGSSIAFRLAQLGLKVVLVDKNGPGAGASGACDKAIFMQSKRPGLHMELALASRRMYDTLESELEHSVEFESDGGMVVIETPRHMEFMKDFIQKQRNAGISVSLIDGDAARAAQPFLAPHILGASYSPDDADVNPLALNAAFFRAARRHGAVLQTHSEVTGVHTKRGRVTAVETTRGTISTELVINAAGPFAKRVGALSNIDIPVQPRRGTILISESIAKKVTGCVLDAQYIASKHLRSDNDDAPPYGVGFSLGQTVSGNLLIGGSREFAGFDKRSDPDVVATIAKHAARIAPELASTRIIRTMTGFRPYTGDGLPIIDWAPGTDGYVIAAGHEGDGLALAPLTGQLVADLLQGTGPTHHFLEGLTLGRFATGNKPAMSAASDQPELHATA